MEITEKAKQYAILKHKGQKRKTGEDYIVHPIGVASLLEQFKKSHNINNLIAVCYLHDTLEDTDTTYYDLVNEFGPEIASIVMELTTNEDMKRAIGKEKYMAYKLKHMTSWALAIKLCDRLHNISDLPLQEEEFKERYSNETLFVINYVVHNRELSNTHREIIKSIMTSLKAPVYSNANQLKKVPGNFKMRTLNN